MYAPSAPGSPLVNLGIAYAIESGVPMTADKLIALRSTLDRFVHGLISYHDAAMLLSPLIQTTQCLDRLDRILRTPPIPLPPCDIQRPDSSARAKSRPWSPYEDQRLLSGIHRFGTADWPAVAAFVGNSRTKSQCYQRWARGLDPSINKTKWTPEQDTELLILVQIFGGKCWARVSAELGNRCDVQCRYRYRQLMKDPRFPQMKRDAMQAAGGFIAARGITEIGRKKPKNQPPLPTIKALPGATGMPLISQSSSAVIIYPGMPGQIGVLQPSGSVALMMIPR